MVKTTIDGWWFSARKTLPHGDGRRVQIGRTNKVKGEIVPCKNGLHLSVRALNALDYAPAPIVWKVRGSGVIVPHNDDKHACSERTPMAGGINATETLRKFARLCALDVIDLWDAPDIVVRYLKTGDESIRAVAERAAMFADAAVGSAADAATWAAATNARAAARAARAAGAAARATGSDAASDAAKKKQNRRLTRMLNAAIKEQADG